MSITLTDRSVVIEVTADVAGFPEMIGHLLIRHHPIDEAVLLTFQPEKLRVTYRQLELDTPVLLDVTVWGERTPSGNRGVVEFATRSRYGAKPPAEMPPWLTDFVIANTPWRPTT